PRGSEEDDGVGDALAVERAQRREIFREDAQRPCVLALHEGLVLVSHRDAWRRGRAHGLPPASVKSMKPRATSVCVSWTRTRSPTRSPSKPRTTRPSAAGLTMRTQVPLSLAPVTMPSNCAPIREARRSAAADF